MNPHYHARVNEAVTEVADLVITANGHANASVEKRDELVKDLLAVVARHYEEPISAEDFIAQVRANVEMDLEQFVGVMEDARQTHVLVLAACEACWLNGGSDDQSGSTDEGVHTYRVDRWIVETNDQGFRNLIEHTTEADAIAHMDILHDDERLDEEEEVFAEREDIRKRGRS